MQITNVLEYLENTVKRVPDKTAYANENMEMTFGEVYHDSRAIGSYLANNNYYKEPVVVFMKKHPHAITAFYGCVYGGCYYVPIDDEMPEFRIRLIFENLHPRVMICDDTTINAVEKFDYNGEILLYDHVRKNEISDELLFGIRDRQLDTDPIYIVFTSGSTGVPKGVVACHRSVIDYIENLSEVLCFNENTRFANQTPLYFDACLKELYPTLKFGATTYIVPKSLFMFPIKLVEFLNEYKINTVCWVVSALTMISAFKTFNKIKPKYLHTIAFGSEVFPIKQLKIWRETLPKARFVNLYGPTEATGMCCYFEVDREFELDEVVPIGRPFHNTEILLLDEPTAGMDALARRQMWNLLKKLNQQNLTILLTTHYMEEAESLCDRVGFMCRDVLRETDTPRHMIEVLGRYAVDETKPDGVRCHYFSEKEEAIRYLSDSPYETSLRNTTLEDVFLEHIGKEMERR